MKKQLSLSEIRPIYKLDIRKGISNDLGFLFTAGYQFDFDIVLSNGKKLQRDLVWSIEQKRSVVISVLKKLNLPPFAVVHYKSDMVDGISLFKIVDGKQRLTSLLSFFNNEFGIIVNGVEYFYNDLDAQAKAEFNSYHLTFDTIYEYPNKKLSDEQLISWFELVNFAGTQQDIKHLENLKS